MAVEKGKRSEVHFEKAFGFTEEWRGDVQENAVAVAQTETAVDRRDCFYGDEALVAFVVLVE